MNKLKEIYNKYREIILYLFWGLITTIVSLFICYMTLKIGVLFIHDENGEPTELLDILGSITQWISGVTVAFITNKLWVFTDAEKGIRTTAIQLLKFSGSRVVTLFVEMGVNLGVIALLGAVGYKAFSIIGIEISDRVWAKIISSVIVVISNYFISKLLVFKKKKEE